MTVPEFIDLIITPLFWVWLVVAILGLVGAVVVAVLFIVSLTQPWLGIGVHWLGVLVLGGMVIWRVWIKGQRFR